MDKPRLRVLVLEDDPLLQRAVARIIRRRGHEVVITGTVEECRQQLSTPVSPTCACPDVLLLDREVLGKDGWSLREEAPESTRVLLMTGSPPPDAPPHILKPFHVDDLIKAIEGN